MWADLLKKWLFWLYPWANPKTHWYQGRWCKRENYTCHQRILKEVLWQVTLKSSNVESLIDYYKNNENNLPLEEKYQFLQTKTTRSLVLWFSIHLMRKMLLLPVQR
jgi:hypothetical protein